MPIPLTQSHQGIYTAAPKLNTAGVFQGIRDDFERRERVQLGQARGRARQMFGPRFRSASEATLGGGLREKTSRNLASARRGLAVDEAQFNQRAYFEALKAEIDRMRLAESRRQFDKSREFNFGQFMGSLTGAAATVGSAYVGRPRV